MKPDLWFTPKQIVSARSPLLPETERGLGMVIEKEQWRLKPTLARKAPGRGGGWEYHLHALPNDAQMRLLAKAGQSDGEASPVNDNRTSPLERRRKIIWGHSRSKPTSRKTNAKSARRC